MTPFRRDGHLTDLALDHVVENGTLAGTDVHLESCAACRARVEAAGSLDSLTLPELSGLPPMASVTTSPAQPVAANRPWMWVALLASVGMVAILAWAGFEPTPIDRTRVKGAGIALQVFLDQGEGSARLRNGDPISAGDRLGFRIRNRNGGHLMVLGLDARDEAYLCYPQHGDGHAEEVEPTMLATPLPEAIRMDATPGTERLIAVFCESPFTFDTAVRAIQDGAIPPGCSTDEVALEKR